MQTTQNICLPSNSIADTRLSHKSVMDKTNINITKRKPPTNYNTWTAIMTSQSPVLVCRKKLRTCYLTKNLPSLLKIIGATFSNKLQNCKKLDSNSTEHRASQTNS